MLDELVGCIDELKDRISKYRNSLNENETRTRTQLIDPLLRALGWDVSDPRYVIPEFKVSDGWADYALLRDNGKPAAMLEAKKLDEPLKPAHRAQMLKYAIELGIPYTGLTDGNHWEFVQCFRTGANAGETNPGTSPYWILTPTKVHCSFCYSGARI